MEGLGREQRERVASYWQRAQGELTSWHGFQHVLAGLRAGNAAPAVIELAERAVRDEYTHAQFCREWAVRFGQPDGSRLEMRSAARRVARPLPAEQCGWRRQRRQRRCHHDQHRNAEQRGLAFGWGRAEHHAARARLPSRAMGLLRH